MVSSAPCELPDSAGIGNATVRISNLAHPCLSKA